MTKCKWPLAAVFGEQTQHIPRLTHSSLLQSPTNGSALLAGSGKEFGSACSEFLQHFPYFLLQPILCSSSLERTPCGSHLSWGHARSLRAPVLCRTLPTRLPLTAEGAKGIGRFWKLRWVSPPAELLEDHPRGGGRRSSHEGI